MILAGRIDVKPIDVSAVDTEALD
jgi:hypothetical protein